MQSVGVGSGGGIARHWRYVRDSRATLALSLLIGLTAVVIVSPELGSTLGPVALLLGFGAASFVMIRNARQLSSRGQWAWTLIGIGVGLGALGVLVLAVVELVGDAPSAYGPVDLLFIGTYVLILTGLALLPHSSGRWSRRLLVLADGLIGAVSLAALLWIWFLSDLLERVSEGTLFARIVGSAYPILDVVGLLAVIMLSVRRTKMRFDARLLLLGLGILLQSIADLVFLTGTLGSGSDNLDPPFGLITLASAAFLAAAIMVPYTPKPREYAQRAIPWYALAIPYVVATTLLVVLFVQLESHGWTATTQILAYAAVLVGGLVVIRQAVSIKETRSVVERERQDLISSISHELRTPLTAVIGFLDVLDVYGDDLPEAEIAEMSHVVREQTRYMARIVTDLVLLARKDVTALDLVNKKVRVADVVDAALQSIQGETDSIVVDVPADLDARIDPERVQQVLVNLVSNAIRYGGERRLVLVTARREDLVIEVHDDGPGVPPKYELVIWERFERGPHRLDAKKPGSGIGLSMVETIAKAYDGSATYRTSERLGGACFEVVLPHCAA